MKTGVRKIAYAAALLILGMVFPAMTPAVEPGVTPLPATGFPADHVVIVGRGERLRDFPCTQCHSLIAQPEGREDAAHPDVVLRHGELNRDCQHCHNSADMNTLSLRGSAETVPFESSYRLCNQCHGNVQKDWESGVHGSQTGFWNGTKNRRTCTACHNPHEPAFKPLKPSPSPERPRGQ
jgi:hypothetical protein